MDPINILGETYLVDIPASHHNGGGALSFADGHSEIRKWVDERTRIDVPKNASIPIIKPSPGNLDVAWLQERSTSLK